MKYVGEFGVDYHHSREVLNCVRERIDDRETTPVLIHPVNVTIPWKETIVPKDNTET